MALLVAAFLSLVALAVAAPPLELDASGFAEALAGGEPLFVKFFAPWCGHCKRLAPTWDELAEKFTDSGVKIVKVDCTVETALCSDHGVRGYPTLKLFLAEDDVKDYKGSRDIDSLSDFVTSNTEATAGEGNAQQQASEDADGGGMEVDAEGVVHLTDATFKTYLKSQPGVHFVKFYAPWCGHCQRLAPTWSKLAENYKSNDGVHIIKVDCTTEKGTCQQHGVQGYPTLVLFEGGMSVDKYSGARTLEALVDFVDANMADSDDEDSDDEEEEEEVKRDASEQEAVEGVMELTADSFQDGIASGLTFVKFFAPWCGHCKRLAPTWDDLARKVHGNLPSVTIAKVDCTAHKEVCSAHGVSGYPTLIMFNGGEKVHEYKQARDLDTLYQFVEEQGS